jgi:ClpP class serine protease
MTAEEAKKLKLYEAAFLEIAQKIRNQQEYAAYLYRQGGMSHEQQELRAVTYEKIVRIVNAVLKRQAADAGVVVLDTALLNVDEGG